MLISKKKQVHKRWFLLIFFSFTSVLYGVAQIADRVYYTDYTINPEEEGELRLKVDNLSFFRNNEYVGDFQKGYSLPGFWIRPTLSYQPKKNIKLEAGLHALRYWGATKYPNYAYKDIAEWKSSHYQKGFHFLPFFRAQIALSPQVDLILGSIYGGANHGLIEPLYNPELNLTSDPETGLQLLYNSSHVKLDAWLNWESFIFYNDYHQEVFTVGLSSSILLNNPDAPFHFYIPVQGLAQHRGGEIDTILTNSVQTLMNGSVGVGVKWNKNAKILKYMDMEADWTGYYQQAGNIWPFDSGSGMYVRASAQLGDFKIKGSYWRCKEFISMFGNPFYGAASTWYDDMTFDSPQLMYLGAEYNRSLGKGYSLGIDFDLYYHFPVDVHEAGKVRRDESATSYAFGVYFRLTPSFMLRRFK